MSRISKTVTWNEPMLDGVTPRRLPRRATSQPVHLSSMPKISAISIYVHDLEQAKSFYRDQLGFKVAGQPAPYIVQLEHDGVPIVLCAAEKPATGSYTKDSSMVLGIGTDDVAKQSNALRAKGATVLFEEPQDFPVGKFNAVRDPSGNVIELLEFRR